jgi:hypothetical protein
MPDRGAPESMQSIPNQHLPSTFTFPPVKHLNSS